METLNDVLEYLKQETGRSESILINFITSINKGKIPIFQQDHFQALQRNDEAHQILRCLQGRIPDRQQFGKLRLVPLEVLL